jgi:hypothetical protein
MKIVVRFNRFKRVTSLKTPGKESHVSKDKEWIVKKSRRIHAFSLWIGKGPLGQLSDQNRSPKFLSQASHGVKPARSVARGGPLVIIPIQQKATCIYAI